MHNWKFLLTSQLLRGSWFLHQDYALAAGADIQQLFSPENKFQDYSEPLKNRLSYKSVFLADNNLGAESGFDSFPKGSIAIFKLSGTLLKTGTLCTYGTEEIGAIIAEAATHQNIDGAIFLIDSGGGAVNAVAPISQAIAKFKELHKPTLALCDAAYSAAYWVASECNYIMADNNISAGFGSIGVMTTFVDYAEAYQKIGIKIHTIYAPESSEKNKAYELALQGKYDEIKAEELSPLAINFQNTVLKNRGTRLKIDEGDKVLKGKTYLAEKAIEIGLIDGIGDMQMAYDKITEMVAINKFLHA